MLQGEVNRINEAHHKLNRVAAEWETYLNIPPNAMQAAMLHFSSPTSISYDIQYVNAVVTSLDDASDMITALARLRNVFVHSGLIAPSLSRLLLIAAFVASDIGATIINWTSDPPMSSEVNRYVQELEYVLPYYFYFVHFKKSLLHLATIYLAYSHCLHIHSQIDVSLRWHNS